MAALIKDVSMLDPELGAIFAALPSSPPFTKEIVPMLRDATAITACPSLTLEEITISGPDNNELTISIFRSKIGAGSLSPQVNRPGIFYIHAGGMILMSRYNSIEQITQMITDSSAVLLSIEYRLAPNHPAPAELNDCYTGLTWMFDHAKDLGIDPSRILIAGASAGGGLATAISLIAHHRGGPRLYAQALAIFGSWQKHQNEVAWKWYLNGKAADKYTSPALCIEEDLKGLQPTFLDVGAVEIFRNEDIEYTMKLLAAKVPTELHV